MSAIQTVSPLSIFFMCVTLLICFGVPIGLAIWGKVKYKKTFSLLPLLLGVIGFAFFQIVLRVNIILPAIQSTAWFKESISQTSFRWLYIVFLCVTAGLFEEPVRFAAFAILRKKQQYPNGLSYGIGHGGIEAILLVGMTYINNLLYAIMINTGTFDPMLSSLPQVYQTQLEAVRASMVSASPDIFLIGGVERVFTMAIQIALSVLVVRGFMVNRKWLYLVFATLLHAVIDFIPSAMQMFKLNMWLIEGAIAVIAILGVIYIISQAKIWRKGQTLLQQQTIPAAE
jgi:uncharacterized membrane protein YhfC